MYTNTNPAELYSGTTWELLTAGKYIQTGNTPLSTGGNNSISIAKANLPNVKLKVDSFSVTTQAHNHGITIGNGNGDYSNRGSWLGNGANVKTMYSNNGGGQNTGTASPSTESLGSGTALNIQPAYITLKFWKRLS